MNRLTYLTNVTTLQLDTQKCNGCRMCTVVCPHNVFKIENKKATISNRDYCMECGACEKNCPEGAIKVESGVGCAAGILAGMLNQTDSPCCCSPKVQSGCC